jgi:hypothetical protein
VPQNGFETNSKYNARTPPKSQRKNTPKSQRKNTPQIATPKSLIAQIEGVANPQGIPKTKTNTKKLAFHLCFALQK